MGMRLNRSLAIRDRAIDSLNGCFSHARAFGLTSADMENQRQSRMEYQRVNKAPRWVREYLAGYWRKVIDGAYRDDLVFGAFIDGVFYSTHSNRVDYYEKHGMSARQWSERGDHAGTLGHYWQNNLKPFFIDSESARKAA